MCSGRLALDPVGRPIVVATTADQVTELGHRFLVLNVYSLGWFEAPGRVPTSRERSEAKAPYQSAPRWSNPVDVPDEELDEREALEAARREQQRAPVDLIGRAA